MPRISRCTASQHGSGGIFTSASGSNYSGEVSNVTFRLADLDNNEVATVFAYDAFGNLRPVVITETSAVLDVTGGGTVSSTSQNNLGTDSPNGSALVTIAGPVSYIVIQFNDASNGADEIFISNIHFTANPIAGADDDSVLGGTGNDSIFGAIGNDTLSGEAGSDFFYGGAGADRLFGGADNDTILGDVGADSLDGGTGDDRLFGGAGNDTVNAGAGNDLIYGGATAETSSTFILNGGFRRSAPSTIDVICTSSTSAPKLSPLPTSMKRSV